MFNKMTKNVLNISALDNRPVMSAEELKATFDRAGVDIKEAFNGLVEQLASETAGEHIGADVESVATKTLQAVLTAFNEAIKDRYTKNEVDTEVSQETNNLVADFDINLTTGVITVTKKDGTKETYDTALEKVPAKFEIVEESEVYYLKISNTDGTSTKVNVNTLFNEYLFTNSDEISFEIANDGNSKRVVARLRDNSIGIEKLSLDIISQLEGHVQNAKSSAESAKGSADIATEKSNQAKTDAMLSKSYAVGGTGTRAGENEDNAKYYKEQVEKKVLEIEDNEKRLDWLESIQDTAKSSGENVYFDNAKNYPLMSLKGEGKSEQYTTIGKQLYNINSIHNKPDSVSVDKDGWITATYDNSTETSTKYLNIITNNLNIKTSTEYAIISQIKSVSGNGLLYTNSYFSNESIISGQFQSSSSYKFNSLAKDTTKVSVRKSLDSFENIEDSGLRTLVSFAAGESGSITFRISVIEDTTVTAENFVYEPYTGGQPAPNPNYPQEISTISEASYRDVGKNIFGNNLSSTMNGVEKTKDGDFFVITGTPNKTWANVTGQTINGVKIKMPAGTYTASLSDIQNMDASYFITYKCQYEDGTYYELTLNKENSYKKTYTFKKDFTGYLYVGGMTVDVALPVIKFKFQFEKGNTATDFESYHESTLPIDLKGNELASVGTVSDKLLIDRKGNVAIEKNVEKRILNGSENWVAGTIKEITNIFSLANFTYKTKKDAKLLSDYFIQNQAGDTEKIVLNENGVGLYLAIKKETASSVEELKTWLQENNVTIYYELKTPKLISLGTISNPEIFKGINNIVVETNLGNMQIEVEYVEDLQKRIEEIDLLIGDLDLALENLTIGNGVS